MEESVFQLVWLVNEKIVVLFALDQKKDIAILYYM